ncbi:hypothetical protein Tco_0773732 [Tanacetum coccineum]|uniref:Retrovirus-related Pol polyprotein from transposon TNT 1-94-like beta-barrel domain-containing protein n=1 Tax=Tanacetum coccineum TaxID=301880 RepID=A0ABQ4ZP40_9ASTR
MTEAPQMDSSLVVHVFSQGDDPIACLNKAMDFLIAVASSSATSSGEARASYSGTGYKGNATSSGGNNTSGLERLLNAITVKTEDLDAYDSDCDDVSNAKAVLMANLSNYGSDVISEVVQIVLWYLDSGCSKHMTGNRSQLINFVSKFLGAVRFKNDQIAKIMRYGDYQLGNVIISRVYYVDELGHNLFSVGQFCDADLEVAFRKKHLLCSNLEGVDLLLGSDINTYTQFLLMTC